MKMLHVIDTDTVLLCICKTTSILVTLLLTSRGSLSLSLRVDGPSSDMLLLEKLEKLAGWPIEKYGYKN